jgi:hypothetical protein
VIQTVRGKFSSCTGATAKPAQRCLPSFEL